MNPAVQSGFLYNKNTKAIPPKQIAILLFDGMEPMGYMGPMTIFDDWRVQSTHGPEVFTFSKNGVVTCDYGRKYHSERLASEVGAVDALLVPGGRGRGSVTEDSEFLKTLTEIGGHTRYILSVCAGAFILNAAGLISTQNVTTHQYQTQKLRDSSDLNVIDNVSCVADQNIWTGGGVFCGSKMALQFIKSFEGYENADGHVISGVYEQVKDSAQHDDVD